MKHRIPTFSSLLLVLLAFGATVAVAQNAPAPIRPYSEADQSLFKYATIHEMTRGALVFGTTAAAFSDPVAAALAVGNRLTDLQADVTEDNAGNGAVDGDADDGGWDFVVTGDTEHTGPGGKSFENIYGPIVRGLVEAAIFTGNARLPTASGDVFAGISQAGTGAIGFPYFRIFDADIATPYVRFADETGNAALKDTIKARYDIELVVRGGAGGRVRTILNGRKNQGNIGLVPWDVHLLSLDAKALGGAFPASVAIYNADMDTVSQIMTDDMAGLIDAVDPDSTWDPTDFLQDWHQLSIAGALRIFTCSPRVDDDALATAMRDTLVAGQLSNGSWGISFGGTFFEDDPQTTAYAVQALIEYADRFGPDAAAVESARKGNVFLMTTVSGSGVVDCGGGVEVTECSAEVVQALLAGSMKLGLGTANLVSACDISGSDLFSLDVTILDVIPDPTDVQGMKINFSFDATELDLLSITVPAGSIWGAVGDFTAFTATGAGSGEINVSSLLFGGVSAGTGGVVCRLNLERKTGAIGVLRVDIASAEIRDPFNSPIAADLTGAEGRANRILGDFTTTLVGSSTDCGLPGFGPPDGDVDVFDLGVFSSHFGAADPAAEYCCIVDIGPTSTGFIFGEPDVDLVIDFEDLVIFAISFGFSTIGGYTAPTPLQIVDQPSQVRLIPVATGSEILVDVELDPSMTVQALHAILDYDPGVLRFVGAKTIGMASGEGSFLAVIPGGGVDLNLAALGVDNAWGELGTVAQLRFERVAEGAARIHFAKLDLRDSFNRGLPAVGEDLTLGGVSGTTPVAVNFLSPAQPNPVAAGAGRLVIRFASAVAQPAELNIYDAAGRQIRTLVSSTVASGQHTVTWDGRDTGGARVSSGVYFARLVYPGFKATQKITLLP